jgi:hypothetical protein
MKKTPLYCFILCFSAITLQAQTRLWNMETLKKAKAENPALVEKIIKEADKYLPKTILSVVDKNKPAPSGDKHDYISCAPYYWPDPANPTGPYIRRDGEKNKAVTTPDKNNMGTMANSIISLSLAYNLTSEEKYAAKAVENLRIWFLNPKTRMNPNLNFGQTIYGYFGGKGRGAGMIETYKLVEMLDGIELLRKSLKFTTTDQENLSKWFTEYLNWMMTSEVGNQEYNAKNNHGTAFDVQLSRVALYVGREDIARKYINDFPSRRIFKQIEPDGKQPAELARTKALHYSAFNITHMLDMCLIAKTLNIDLLSVKSEDGRNILKAIEFMAQYAGKQQNQFPFSQINEWNQDQKLLIFQLYRMDKITGKSTYKNLYINKMADYKSNYSIITN